MKKLAADRIKTNNPQGCAGFWSVSRARQRLHTHYMQPLAKDGLKDTRDWGFIFSGRLRIEDEIIGVLKCNLNILGGVSGLIAGAKDKLIGNFKLTRSGGMVVFEEGFESLSTRVHDAVIKKLQNENSEPELTAKSVPGKGSTYTLTTPPPWRGGPRPNRGPGSRPSSRNRIKRPFDRLPPRADPGPSWLSRTIPTTWLP